ncbi:MAG: site-specific integrase [Thermodesulfobacteriota bacterium]|nr:site-specific integrase [Thermodesulfobacteriota bacterium]
MRELKTTFNWLVSRRLCPSNPCIGIEEYEEDSFVRYVPPPEDINAVLLAAEPWEYDFLQCIYHTAARRGEIQRVKWDDINFQTGKIILWTRKRKGGSLEPDELSMNSVLAELLENRYRDRHRESPYVFPNNDGQMISKNTLDNVMPRLCRKTGIKPFGFHAIRHHVSAIMADSKKLSLVQIQKQLRHKRTTTTDIYLKSFTGDETGAAGVLEKAQKKEVHTKVHTIYPKKKTESE